MHGHWNAHVGSFYYGRSSRLTPNGNNMPPTTTDTNRHRWIAACATNKGGNAPYFVNGIKYTTLGGTLRPVSVRINYKQKSDWGVAFVATWSYHMSESDMKKMADWLNAVFVSNHNSNGFCLPPRASIPSVSVSPSTGAKTYSFAGKSCKTNASSKVSQHTVVTVIFMIFCYRNFFLNGIFK